MLLTTTAGTEVEVPVTLPDCFTFFAYLPTLGGVHAFVCWPSHREEPANAEPDWLAFADPDGMPYVSPADLDFEDRALYDDWRDTLVFGAPCPFRFLDRRDASAVSEAAGDVLGYVAHRLSLCNPAVGSPLRGLSVLDALKHRDTLRSIADMRAAELAAWKAWEQLPASLRNVVRNRPENPTDNDGSHMPSYDVLAAHVELLMEQSETWSREKAEKMERETAPHTCDTAPSGSEKQGGGECGACQRGE